MSTHPQRSESGAGGKGIFIALIPWIARARFSGSRRGRHDCPAAEGPRERPARARAASAGGGQTLGAADPEAVETIATRVGAGDDGAWVGEWTAGGGAAWASAKRAPSASAYLHAASRYAAALALIDESDGLVDQDRLWERQRECWDRAVGLLGSERLSISYGHATLPGYSFCRWPRRPATGGDRSRRPGRYFRGAGRGRGRSPRVRISLDDVRRAGSPGGSALARHGSAPRLGGRAPSGRGRDGRTRGRRLGADRGHRPRPRRIRGAMSLGVRASVRRCGARPRNRRTHPGPGSMCSPRPRVQR